ncbi:integrase catalytic domain-containing protein [Trichonephila clavipes]|nr:integrase catalytic domain-containing protein [Trichonephila clavipes]
MEGLPYCNLYRSKFGDKKIWRPKVGPPRIQPKLDKHLSVKNSPSTITLSNQCSRDRTKFSQRKRYATVSKITDEQILNNLRELNIEFSDSFSEDLEIDLLVGSNVLGRILMKKCELDSSFLSVVETKLGNTVIGMQDDVCHIDRNVMTTLSMYVRNFKLTDLWSLESLGISNPTLEESKQNSYEDSLNDFQQKLTILFIMEEVTVPRYIAINETSELHIFVDASKSSYGACVFVRTVVENDVKVTLLRSKTRVAPLKSLTIPRLELMSCCLGARLANSIIRALNLPGISSNSPMSEPVSLPADRVKDANAFDITGIDLAGPLFTRDGDGLLRRTRPETIYTDNGTNFVGTNSELKNLDWDKIMKETDIKPIKWKFNPPTAAWWGGWWERLVRERVIKEILKRTLGKAILTYEELLTVLCDCEAVVNSRPLTYVSGRSE